MDPRVENALARLETLSDAPLREQRDALNEEMCTVTGSSIAYIAALDLDESVLTMVGWSLTAMDNCGMMERPIVYPIETTGLWGDAVRERGPVITNDYKNTDKPTKKGYPKGHVDVERHFNVPIFEGDRIALVVGVGNKPTDYTMEDVQNIEDLMYGIWDQFKATLWASTW